VEATLGEAIRAHQQEDYPKAVRLYNQLIASGKATSAVFQNLGALLRSEGKQDEALKIYGMGLETFPGDPGILSNRANIIKERAPASAVVDLLDALQTDTTLVNSWITAITILADLQCQSYALHVANEALRLCPPNIRLTWQVVDTLVRYKVEDPDIIPPGLFSSLLTATKRSCAKQPILSSVENLLLAAYCCAQYGYNEEAANLHATVLNQIRDRQDDISASLGSKLEHLVMRQGWNIGCALLKVGDFTNGWRLYDYGLRVPTKTPQKWQRALRKPFSSEEVPLWRGECLEGKNLLVLEEQGVGDTMMFITLLPKLSEEVGTIDLIVSDRLCPVYRRVFEDVITVWSFSDFCERSDDYPPYDFQTALGSIPQYRFTSINTYAPRVPILKVDDDRVQTLRSMYLERLGCGRHATIVGVSWSGGGSKSRIQAKSIPLAGFEQILRGVHDDVVFLCLQYGDVSQRIEEWLAKDIPLIHDTSIDPLLDLDGWLHQVAACDAVLSVANTTIHGAGGLNIPTLCLLSDSSDWRWLSDITQTRSYWYPSVSITRQNTTSGWGDSIAEAIDWINHLVSDRGAALPLPQVS